MESIPRIFAHMAWADQRAIESIRSLREPPPQALDLLAHTIAAEHVWLRRIEGRKPAYEVWPKLTLDQCERLAAENHAGFAALLGKANEKMLAAPVSYSNTSGRAFDTSLRDILLHISHHGMYHRGQISLLVRSSGGVPQPTDYIVFVRDQ